jgi:hypothetical protein
MTIKTTKDDPPEVVLTRLVQLSSIVIDATFKANGEVPDEIMALEHELRRALWRAVGWLPCDELGEDVCSCDELEPPRPITDDEPCTGMWRGCIGCNENFLSYAEGVGEYDLCKACHWDRVCLDPEAESCGAHGHGEGCMAYPDREP